MDLIRIHPGNYAELYWLTWKLAENFSAFEVDEELLPNLREYSLANAIYWGLAEGHACEQSARRNAMDVSQDGPLTLIF